jgi:iron-only hydrogenase group A
MVVKTQSRKVIEARRMGLELLIAQHPLRCLTCYRNGKCQLQDLAQQYGLQQARFCRRDTLIKDDHPAYPPRPIDQKSPAIAHDPNMCVLCGLCIEACRTIQAVDVIDFAYRSYERTVEPAFGQSLADVECTACGQCIQLCPVNAFYEKSDLSRVQNALQDPDTHVVALLSPVVGVSIGEEFGQEAGTSLDGQLVTVLKHSGFDRVFHTGFGVDVVLLEEAYELLTRLKSEKRLPMISSSSPAAVKYFEHFYPKMLPLFSTCKSPAQALGSLVKTYYATQYAVPPEQIVTVSLTPCTAEKFECTRPEMVVGDVPAIDACLTTKEIASLIQGLTGDRILSISPQPYDPPFDTISGAGLLFGAPGGMLEGVMRTFYELLTEKKLPAPEFPGTRDPQGVQDITLKMGSHTIHAAVVHSTGHVSQVLEKIKEGQKRYHYIEIKGCPQGCAQGGGEPLPYAEHAIRARSHALYQLDEAQTIRKAHENPGLKHLYERLLKKPAAAEAKKLLHTKFTPRERYL